MYFEILIYYNIDPYYSETNNYYSKVLRAAVVVGVGISIFSFIMIEYLHLLLPMPELKFN